MNIALESEKVIPLESNRLEMLKQIADALAAQFGPNCEVVIHDLSAQNAEHPIVYIVNGHVTGRKVGDRGLLCRGGQLTTNDPAPRDHLAYLTRTPDGKILKSSTVYIRTARARSPPFWPSTTTSQAADGGERGPRSDLTGEPQQEEPEKIVNVNDLLEELIQQSVSLVGKPVALMNKEDKVRAIRFLESERRVFGDQVRRQDRQVFRHLQVHFVFLYRHKTTGGQVSMIDLTINKTGLEHNLRKAKENRIIIPTIAQMQHPEYQSRRDPGSGYKSGLWDVVDPCSASPGRTRPRRAAGCSRRCPTHVSCPGAHGRPLPDRGSWWASGSPPAATRWGLFRLPGPRLVTGQFDADHKAVWPSTGNYCRGGAFNSRLLGAQGVAILPAEMSRSGLTGWNPSARRSSPPRAASPT